MRSDPTIELLLTRRSVKPLMMKEPGPSESELETILRAGARVPDHGKLVPWRFIVFKGAARTKFGKLLRKRLAETEPTASDVRLTMEAGRFERAPLVVGVVSKIVESNKVPEWEQRLSVGACCQNILIAATALGYASCWLTEWCAYDPVISKELGLAINEHVAGFIYLGSPTATPDERERPELSAICLEWPSS